MALLVGVDGCAAGWLCVAQAGSSPPKAWVSPSFFSLLSLSPRPEVMAVAAPIGLVDKGTRECDREARRILGRPTAGRLLAAPTRQFLPGRRQGIVTARVREVDAFMTPEHQAWVHEVHPELSYTCWNSGKPLAASKKRKDGQAERHRLIEMEWPDSLARLSGELGIHGGWQAEDLTDAFAALWTARRIARSEAMTLASATPDSRGLRMCISA